MLKQALRRGYEGGTQRQEDYLTDGLARSVPRLRGRQTIAVSSDLLARGDRLSTNSIAMLRRRWRVLSFSMASEPD
jgi:hypothetical protein